MKKKLFLAVAAIIATASLSLSSCSSNPADQVISLYEKAAKEVTKADSKKEINDIDDKLDKDIMEIVRNNLDFEPTDAQDDALKNARAAYREAKREAKKKF